MNKTEMILFDMDGTLFHSDRTISPYTTEIFKKAHKQGVKLFATTGRPPFLLNKFFKQADLEGIVDGYISLNGICLIDFPLGINKFTHQISGDWLPEIMEKCTASGIKGTFVVYNTTEAWLTKKNDYAYGAYVRAGFNSHLVKDYSMFKGQDVWKILFIKKTDFTESEIDYLHSINCDRYHGFVSIANIYEIINAKVNKGEGAKELAKLNKIDLKNVVMFGDGDNDLPVLKIVGMPIAMGNATKAVKDCALEVTQTNNEDGVAKWIERNVLNG